MTWPRRSQHAHWQPDHPHQMFHFCAGGRRVRNVLDSGLSCVVKSRTFSVCSHFTLCFLQISPTEDNLQLFFHVNAPSLSRSPPADLSSLVASPAINTTEDCSSSFKCTPRSVRWPSARPFATLGLLRMPPRCPGSSVGAFFFFARRHFLV